MRILSWLPESRFVGSSTMIALLVLVGGAARAEADVLQTFAASGTFTNGSVLQGSLVIDETTGIITASDLITTGPSSFTFVNIVNQTFTQAPGDYNVGDRNALSTEDFNFDLPDPTQAPLIGYHGGRICSDNAPCVSGRNAALINLATNTADAHLVSGFLEPVPEPTSITLLMVGLIGLAGVLLVRRKCPALLIDQSMNNRAPSC